MTSLHQVAKDFTAVLCSLHQPASGIFQALSRAILLAHGRTVFCGPPAALYRSLKVGAPRLQMPEGFNVADFALEVIGNLSPTAVAEAADAFKLSSDGLAITAQIEAIEQAAQDIADFEAPSPPSRQPYRTSYTREFVELSRRNLLNLWRDPLLLAAHWGTGGFIAILMITLYSNTREAEEEGGAPGVHNRLGALFFVVAFLALSSLSGLDLFLKERTLFVRERAACLYHTGSYFVARICWDLLLLRAMPATALGASTYHLAGLRSGAGHFGLYLMVVTMLSINCGCLAYGMGATAPNTAVATFSGAMAVLVYLLFGGLFVSNKAIPWYMHWVQYFTPIYYAYETMAINEFDGTTVKMKVDTHSIVGTITYPLPGETFMDMFGFSAQHLTRNLIALVTAPIGTLTFAFLVLLFTHKEKR